MFKTKTKYQLIKTILLGILLIPQIGFARDFINLGTLDVKLADQQEQLKLNLTAGDRVQKELRVSNFSSETKQLKIYVADAEEKSAQNFVAKDKNQLSEDIFSWIKLPTDNFELKAGESKLLSVNIYTPKNAGVGMHTGAIMVSEKQGSSDNQITVEKGIRLYLSIKGTPVPNLNISHLEKNETGRFINFSPLAVNTGNTDLRGEIKLSILDQDNQVVSEQKENLYLKPGQTREVNLFAQKPSFGFYKIELTQNLFRNSKESLYSSAQLFFPQPVTYGLLALLIGFSLIFISKKIRSNFDYPKSTEWLYANKLALQRSGLFLGLFVFTTAIAIQLPNLNTHLFTDVLNTPALSGYKTTVKWGNMNQLDLPNKYKVNWKGYLTVKYGKMSILEKLHNEGSDNIDLNKEGTVLSFENQTGPDNDGIIIQIDPTTSDQVPTLTYKNTVSKEEYSFSLNENLYSKESFSYKLHAIEIQSMLAAEKITPPHLPTAAELESGQNSGSTATDTSNTGGTPPTDTSNSGGTTPTDTSNSGGTPPTDTSNSGGTTPTDTSNSGGTTPTDTSNTGGNTPADISNTGGNTPADTPNTGDTSTNTNTTNPSENPIQDANSTENIDTINNPESTPDINTENPPAENNTDNSTQTPTNDNNSNQNSENNNSEQNSSSEIIKETTSSPEILTNYILATKYVREISKNDYSKTLEAEPNIIEQLKDSPDTIKDIISSPDLNFVFIPNQKISFSPQQFSFNQSRKTSQDLGEIVFVQNKQTTWNTYLTVTDFVSLSGEGTIPASAITINPGEIKMLTTKEAEDIIAPGTEKTLNGSSDSATLVSVQPHTANQYFFVMRPRVSIEVPPGTLPGLYRAEISVKVL